MNRHVLIGTFMFLGLAFTACHDDDPNYDNVQPPTVEVAPNTLSGVVTTIQGNPVNGATITIDGKMVTTNSDGVYQMSDITAGTYTIKASADGMIPKEASLVVEDSKTTQNLTWSVSLAKEIVEDVNVTVDEGGSGTVESEAIEGNNKGEIAITVDVPSNTVPENTTIIISPIYTEESAVIAKTIARSRATAEKMLIGANVTCNNPDLILANPINVSFAVDETVTESVETQYCPK